MWFIIFKSICLNIIFSLKFWASDGGTKKTLENFFIWMIACNVFSLIGYFVLHLV